MAPEPEQHSMLPVGASKPLQAEERDDGPLQPGNKRRQLVAGFCATLGAMAAGTVLAWSSPMLAVLQAPDSFLPVTVDEASWIGSLMPIGAFFGALIGGPLTDKLGRKTTLAILSAPFVLSWLLIVLASSVPMLYAARFIGGLATGCTSVAATTYVAEIGELSVKGALGSFFQLQVTIGILLTFVVAAVASYTVLAVASGVLPVLWLGAVLFLPETPVFLLKRRKPAEAERSLRWLRGEQYDVKRELGQMQRAVDEAARNQVSFGDLFRSRTVMKALIICLGLMVFQQVSGVNAIMFYTVQIFEAAGSTLSPIIATIIVGLIQVVMTAVAAMIIDRLGRRILLLMSAVVMALMLGVLGFYFFLKSGGSDVSAIGWLPLACVVLFGVVFSLAFGPIPWMMAGELFEASLQAPASSLAAAVNWFLAFGVTKIFATLLAVVDTYGTFWLFSGCCAVAAVFVFVMVPETKGKTIAEVQDILSGRR